MLCFANATHNFNRVKITHICLIHDLKIANVDVEARRMFSYNSDLMC